MDPLSPHPLPEVGRHGSSDLLTDGNFDSVEAWLRAEKEAWHYAADHATTRSKQYTFRETANFYERRLDEHLARRTDDDPQS
jgi:hypothetical protein